MKKKIAIYIGIIILTIISVFLIFRPKTAGKEIGEIMLFTRYDCPHCQKVDSYIQENNIKNKIKFTEKEIHDTENAKSFIEKAGQCGIPQDQMGVPMLYDGQKCYSGDEEIINFFNER